MMRIIKLLSFLLLLWPWNGSDGSSPFKIDLKSRQPLNSMELYNQTTSTFNENQLLLKSTNRHNPFRTIYEWNIIDFQYPNEYERALNIDNGNFIPENVVPLGVDIDTERFRMFLTFPRWKNGVPASLAWLPLPATTTTTSSDDDYSDNDYRYEKSPAVIPYPNQNYHLNLNEVERMDGGNGRQSSTIDCTKLISVYRLFVDECHRLWVIDGGVVNATIKLNQLCPPKLVVFNLLDDTPIFIYHLPSDQIKEDSLHTNVIVDIRNGECDDAHAYITDVWRYGLTVFSLKLKRSWRTTNHLYQPNPLASNYLLHGLRFQWPDGIFGIALSPMLNEYNDRLLYFHPMSSYAEFMVSTSILRNETIWTAETNPTILANVANTFVMIGERGPLGQSSTSGIDSQFNVMFYNLIQRDGVGCWPINKPYTPANLCIIAESNETMIFPNDLKLDRGFEKIINSDYPNHQNHVRKRIDQGIWIVTNRLPIFLYSTLNLGDVNFRIQRASVDQAIYGTCCQ